MWIITLDNNKNQQQVLILRRFFKVYLYEHQAQYWDTSRSHTSADHRDHTGLFLLITEKNQLWIVFFICIVYNILTFENFTFFETPLKVKHFFFFNLTTTVSIPISTKYSTKWNKWKIQTWLKCLKLKTISFTYRWNNTTFHSVMQHEAFIIQYSFFCGVYLTVSHLFTEYCITWKLLHKVSILW